MKYIKMFGVLAVVAAALMAFAAGATAKLTSPAGTVLNKGAKIHAVNEGTHVTLENPIAKIECNSTVEGEVAADGGTSGPITHLTFFNCTNGWHVTAVTGKLGSLSIESTGGGNGVLRSTGTRVDATRLGVTCVYETENTSLGTVTGGNPATLNISASIPIAEESSGLCGTKNAAWSGGYVTTNALFVD